MIKVLFISYQFPPLSVGGVYRPLKFVKYFNDYQIEPFILTLPPNEYKKVYHRFQIDNNWLNEIDRVRKQIIYVPTENLLASTKNRFKNAFNLYFNFFKGREAKFWRKSFFSIAESLIKKHDFKAIIVTAPPFSVIGLAVKLAQKNNLPLIIDMRDSMSMWVYAPYATYFHFFITKFIERYWFKKASKIISVTEQMIKDWKRIHKRCDKSKFCVIPNGFDSNLQFSEIRLKPSDKLTIGYIGSFYYEPSNRELMFQKWYKKTLHRKFQYVPRKEDWLYRSPFFLFKTMKFLFKKSPELKNKLFVKIAGNKPEWLIQMINKFDLNNNVELVGFLSSEKLEDFKKNCDAWLSTSVKVIGGEDYCIAGKTFDYIVTSKPILAFVTNGAQKDFLLKSGMAVFCNPDKIEDAANEIEKIIKNGIVLKPNKDFIENFDRKILTQKLANIIHSL